MTAAIIDDLRSASLPMPRRATKALAIRIGSFVAQAIALAAISVGLFFFCFAIFSKNNQFPLFYHPDEPSKVEQIVRDDRNFNHPQLMLETAVWLLAQRNPPMAVLDGRGEPVINRETGKPLLQSPRLTSDQIAVAGRDGSAYLAAGAAVLLAWAGFFAAGWAGFIMVAIGAGLCPPLLAHSHYFKEEASLCFGVAAVICVGSAMCRRVHWSILIVLSLLLGGACGLAASGKYAGIIMIVPAIVLVIMLTWWRWWLLPICLALVGLGAWQSWSYINYRAIENWDEFVRGFEREKEHGLTDHFGITMNKPNGFFIDKMWIEAMPHVKVLAIAAPFALLLMRRRAYSVPSHKIHNPRKLPRGQIWHDPDAPARTHSSHPVAYRWPGMVFPMWLILTLVFYTGAVSWSAIPFYRYIVPSSLLLYVLAALGAVWLTDLIEWPRVRLAVLAVVIIGSAHLQADRCADHNRQFAVDSRDLLRDWVNRYLPPGTVIAADGYTELGAGGWSPKYRTRAQVYRGRWAAEMADGNIDSLRARGIRYIAVAGTSYERFIDPYTYPVPGYEREFDRNAQFYRDLFEHCPVVWKREAAHPMMTFANPDITLFRLPNKAGEPQPRQRRRWFW